MTGFQLVLLFFINISSIAFCQWPPPPSCEEIRPGTQYSCPGSNCSDRCTNKCQYNVHTIPNSKTRYGGAPHWDQEAKSLYFVDFLGDETNILRYDWKTKKIYKAGLPYKLLPVTGVAFINPVKDSKDLFAIGDSSRVVKLIKWDGISPEVEYVRNLFAVEQQPYYSTNYWHISAADPEGRFYGGTFRENICGNSTEAKVSYYDWTPKQGVKKLIGGAKLFGSFAVSPATHTFYLADLCRNRLLAYEWCPETGDLMNGRTAFDYNNSTMPDYAIVCVALDRQEMIWSNLYGTGQIWRVDPRTSKKIDSFMMPVPNIVNCAFGGDCYDVLFCTSASVILNIHTGEVSNSTLPGINGSLFMITGFESGGYDGNRLSLACK